MTVTAAGPRAFRILERDALEIHETPYGAVGTLYSGDSIEAQWIAKQNEAIDPEFFTSPRVDLILVVQGHLRVEFEDPRAEAVTLGPAELLVLQPNVACRAYCWPRDAAAPTVFVAFFPSPEPERDGLHDLPG